MTARTIFTIAFLFIFSLNEESRAFPGDNLLKDGSFEHVKAKDRHGRVFTHWLGWVHDKNGWFEPSRIASNGRYSCRMQADERGKIRISSQKLDLAPGRYKVTFDLRGLDIAPHRYNTPIDFSMGFDREFFSLNRTGNFDWIKVSYVFDLPRETRKKPQFFVGLLGAGMIWVDNVKLVAVSSNTPITDKPRWGVGKPIQSVQKPHGSVHCPLCGFKNEAAASHCFACGTPIVESSGSKGLQKTFVLADFELSRKPFSSGRVDSTFAGHGKKSLKLTKGWTSIEKPLDFSGYDEILFDVHNPQSEPVPLIVEIRDVESKGYWGRVNYNTIAPPGKSTVYMPTHLYVGEKARPGRALLRDRITFFSIGIGKKGPIYIDHLRLNRLDLSGALFKELKFFDFGKVGSPVMSGALPVNRGQEYNDQRGFGFVKARLWRSQNVLQPDPLVQDFICPENGIFRVKLKNGKYRILMKIDSPGGYWGEVAKFKKRQITLNGRPVINESQTFETFTKNYFQDADIEDVPGASPFKRYVESRIPWREFQVEVSDGKLDIGFLGKDWAVALSSLVIYPEDRLSKGRKFVQWLDGRRRFVFDYTFQEIGNDPKGLSPLQKGFRLFQRPLGDLPGPWDGPLQEKSIVNSQKTVSLVLAGAEHGHVQLSVQSGKLPTHGEMEIKVTTLKNSDGYTLKPDDFDIGWFDFRIKREEMDGSVWSLKPRYFQRGKVSIKPGLTRTFLVGGRLPLGEKAGLYQGAIEVLYPGEPKRSIPFEVRVLPFDLEPIEDIAVGPWGSGIRLPWFADDSRTRKWNWMMFKKSLQAIKNSGSTSFSGRPSVQVRVRNGFVDINTSVADKEMAFARSLGFHHIISSYGVNSKVLGYRLAGGYNGPDTRAARRAGFPGMQQFLKEVYTKIDRQAVKKDWLPVAWNLCDEPSGGRLKGAVKNAYIHRMLVKGLKRTTFMGATSLYGDNIQGGKRELVKNLPIAALNKHDKRGIQVVHDASNIFGFYNEANRWTMGRYMKMLVERYQLGLRLVWHYNVVAGNPYYALDCREDDYCWYNSNTAGNVVPSAKLLTEILPGLNDYKYLTALRQKLDKSVRHPNYHKADKVWKAMMELEPGADRERGRKRTKESLQHRYGEERRQVIAAIMMLEQ